MGSCVLRWVGALAFVSLLNATALAESTARLPVTGKDGAKPNVLLITIDTLRMDHLGAYGYALPTSPAIDQLAKDGVLFTDAITPTPMTAPAVASLLTGQYVNRHHVHENAGTIPENVTSLAEAFADAGYDTAAIYGNEALEDFGRGFKVFEEFPRKEVPKGLLMTDELGVARGLEWLETAKEPWFLWLHLIDPHGAYDSSPLERSAAFTYPDDPELNKELETSDKNWVYGAVPQYQGLEDVRRVGDYVRRYDGEIVGSDLEIAKIRAWLENKGEFDHTLLVLTSDHGESLTEDNYYFQHGKSLNEPSVRVPFLIRHGALPSGIKVDAPVSLIDVYPTIAALAGLPVPADVDGKDVSGTLFGENLGDRTRITYTVTPDLQVGIYRGPWRMYGRPVRKDGAVDISKFGFVVLTDTTQHPEKRVPLRREQATVKALKKELVEASKRMRTFSAPKVELTEKQTQRLRALGYID